MSDPDQKPPKYMKFEFTPAQHRVWESIFPTPDGTHIATAPEYAPRRRRPSRLYMSKIIRSLAELGVYPVFRTTATGELIPWDTEATPQRTWLLDPGIRALLGNANADPEINIDAYYHPIDLAKHFGANPEQWTTWAMGMTGVRTGPVAEDVVLRVTLGDSNVEYLRQRNILKRTSGKVRLVSTGGAAFFAAAAVEFWATADDRARIGRLKTKLAVDFQVLRNHAPLPADPVVADLDRIADSVHVGVPRGTRPEVAPVTQVAAPEPVSQVPLFVQPAALSPEEELRLLEIRAAELRREIEARDLGRRIEEGRRRHHADIEAFRTAVGSAKVSAVVLRVPDFDPGTPDRGVSDDIRIDGVLLTLPDGREFAFGEGRLLEKEVPDIDADRAAFEADPVGYTFGG